MSRYSETFDKYYHECCNQHKDKFDEISNYAKQTRNMFNKIHGQNLEIKINSEETNTIFEKLIHYKYTTFIDKYFLSANGNAGLEFNWICRSIMNIIVHQTIIDKNNCQKELAKEEMKRDFYNLLNTLYNYKEKVEIYFGIKPENGNIEMNALLYKGNKENLLNKIKLLYDEMKDYCNMRNDLVHECNEMDYDTLNHKITVNVLDFSLNHNRLEVKYTHSMKLNIEKFIELLNTILKTERLIVEESNEIDYEIFLNKLNNQNNIRQIDL